METETPAARTEPTHEKAGKGARFLALLIALVLAFLAAVAVVASIEITDLTPCDDVTGAQPFEECFDGSSTEKIASLVFAWPGAILAVLAVLLTLAFVVRGRGGQTAIKVTVAAAVLFGLGILVGSL